MIDIDWSRVRRGASGVSLTGSSGGSPAGVDTDFVPGRTRGQLEAMADKMPLRKITSPDDVAGHRKIRAGVAPVQVATGEMCQNRIIFKQLIMRGAIVAEDEGVLDSTWGGTLADMVTMTVFINDPRHGDAFVKIRSAKFEAGRYPASALLTVSTFARPGLVIEIQGVAVW